MFKRIKYWLDTLDPDKELKSLAYSAPTPVAGLLDLAQQETEPSTEGDPVETLNPDPGPLLISDTPDTTDVVWIKGGATLATGSHDFEDTEKTEATMITETPDVDGLYSLEDDVFTADDPEGNTDEDFDQDFRPLQPVFTGDRSGPAIETVDTVDVDLDYGNNAMRDLELRELPIIPKHIPSRISVPASAVPVTPPPTVNKSPKFSKQDPEITKLRELHTNLIQLVHEDLNSLEDITHAEDLIRVAITWIQSRMGDK